MNRWMFVGITYLVGIPLLAMMLHSVLVVG
jgi:hypothetical protein